MILWSISCRCGFETDFKSLREARVEGKKHLNCHEDGKVYLDQVDTDPPEDGNGDYLTGKTVILKKKN